MYIGLIVINVLCVCVCARVRVCCKTNIWWTIQLGDFYFQLSEL